MSNIIDNIIKTVYQIALDENCELEKLCQYGIFHMPELAFAYKCGKNITLNKEKIFMDNEYMWVREMKYKNYGIADMIFKPNDKKNPELVFEFKMDDTWHEYLRDIKKLINLVDETKIFRKFFCAQKWVLDNKQSIEFMNILNNEFPVKNTKLLYYKCFNTYINPSKKESCLFSFWEII